MYFGKPSSSVLRHPDHSPTVRFVLLLDGTIPDTKDARDRE